MVREMDLERRKAYAKSWQNIWLHRYNWPKMHAISPVLDIGTRDGTIFSNSVDGIPSPPDITFFDLDMWIQEWKPDRKFVRGDARRLPFKDNSFISVTLCDVLEHVPDPLQVLNEAVRVASQRVVFTTPDEYHSGSANFPCQPHESEKPDYKERTIKDTLGCQMKEARCLDTVDDDVLRHLYHIQHFDEGELLGILGGLSPPGLQFLLRRIWYFGDPLDPDTLVANFAGVILKT